MTQIAKAANKASTVIYICSIKITKGLNREEGEGAFQVEKTFTFSVKQIPITYLKSFHVQILEMFSSWAECIIIVLYMTSVL